jgi:hypothetical protein
MNSDGKKSRIMKRLFSDSEFEFRREKAGGWTADIIIGKMLGEFDIKAAGEGPPVLYKKNRPTENNYLLSDSD